jgi:hypothetical protein
MAGYEDVNDAERLSQGPTFRLIGSEKIWDRGAALDRKIPVGLRHCEDLPVLMHVVAQRAKVLRLRRASRSLAI